MAAQFFLPPVGEDFTEGTLQHLQFVHAVRGIGDECCIFGVCSDSYTTLAT